LQFFADFYGREKLLLVGKRPWRDLFASSAAALTVDMGKSVISRWYGYL
jgi:hypothetical protein